MSDGISFYRLIDWSSCKAVSPLVVCTMHRKVLTNRSYSCPYFVSIQSLPESPCEQCQEPVKRPSKRPVLHSRLQRPKPAVPPKATLYARPHRLRLASSKARLTLFTLQGFQSLAHGVAFRYFDDTGGSCCRSGSWTRKWHGSLPAKWNLVKARCACVSSPRSSSKGRAALQSQDYSVLGKAKLANYTSLCSCLPLIVLSMVVSSRNALLEVSQADDAMGCPAPSAWLHMASYMAWASASQQSKLSACQAQLESQKSLFITKRSWMQSWEDAQKWNHFSSLLPMNELMPALLAAFLKYHYSTNLKGSQLTSPALAAKLECSIFPNNMSDLPFQTWRSIKVSGTHFQWLQARSSNGLDAKSHFRRFVTTLPDSETCRGFAWHLHDETLKMWSLLLFSAASPFQVLVVPWSKLSKSKMPCTAQCRAALCDALPQEVFWIASQRA